MLHNFIRCANNFPACRHQISDHRVTYSGGYGRRHKCGDTPDIARDVGSRILYKIDSESMDQILASNLVVKCLQWKFHPERKGGRNMTWTMSRVAKLMKRH